MVRKKHQWTKERLCVTYETLLVTQALDDKAYECHNSSSATERHTMVQAEVKHTEEDQRKARATEHGKQKTWMKWGLPQRKLTWKEL